MPTYRNLSVSLVSQFDVLTIPEYAPPSPGPLASPPSTAAQARSMHDVASSTAASLVGLEDPFTTLDSHSQSTNPTIRLVDPARSLVSVYIPTYPSSQFWLSYAIAPPHPPGLFYYFKLLINGSVIVSWGVGKDDGWKGKTMFALYPADTRLVGEGGGSGPRCSKRVNCNALESRTLSFAPSTRGADESRGTGWLPEHLRDVMEIRVYRSKGRARIEPELSDFDNGLTTKKAKGGKGQRIGGSVYGGGRPSAGSIELVNAGPVSTQHPKRFYKYALLDPLDRPFVTFRYFSRTWENLEELGVISPSPSSRASCSDEMPDESTDIRFGSDDAEASNHLKFSTNYTTHSPPSDSDSPVMTPRSPTPEADDTMTEDLADSNAWKSPKRWSQIRPLTPPPSLDGVQTVRFVPTAAGLVTTNIHCAEASLPKRIPSLPLRHQSSREKFAALVRSSMSTADPDSFRMGGMSATPRPDSPFPMPEAARTDPVARGGNGNLFKTVIQNAFAKQKRPGSASSNRSAASSKSSSGRLSAGNDDRSVSASPMAADFENLSVDSESNGRGSRQDKGKRRDMGSENQEKEKTIFRKWAGSKKGKERALQLSEEVL